MTDLVRAEAEQTQALARQAQARELGVLYHPYNLENGRAQSIERVAARFANVWARLAHLAAAADLPARANTSPRRSA